LVLSIVHVGVEQGFWPSPLPECAAPRLPAGSLAEQLRAMPAAPSKACDMPTQLLPFLPSMAALNGIASAVIAALALLLARRPPRHRLRRHRAWERRR
jgi:disulfide bond formation protein DsbB